VIVRLQAAKHKLDEAAMREQAELLLAEQVRAHGSVG